MPISPTVSAWMAQGAQKPADDQDSLFKKSFSDNAFNSLRAKAPAIIPYVTTFKTFDYSIDDGDAFGTFILSYGGTDLLFIPIVMFGGSITSCEMAYIRAEDRFVPLSDDFIQKIVNKNNATMATPLSGPVKVEDTRQMFRNIIRPPMSSNVVFASHRLDISELPNDAKKRMSDYLRSHPALLGKIAEFYPVEVLAERLAQRQTKTASIEVEGPLLLKLAEITVEAVERLGEFDKAVLLKRGWLLKNATVETAHAAAPADFGHETLVRLSEHGKGDVAKNDVRRAKVVRFDGGKFKKDDAIILNACGDCGCCPCPVDASSVILMKDGSSMFFGNRIVLEDSRSADEDDLKEFGFVGIGELRGKLKTGGKLLVVVPRKHGGWSTANTFEIYGDKFSVVESDGDYAIREGDTKLVEVTDSIRFGSIKGKVVPKDALFKVVDTSFRSSLPGIVDTLQNFFDIIRSHGVVLRVADSSGVTEITDTTTQKTASFQSQGDAAKWLNMEYGLSERQICETLGRPETLVLTKFADEYMSGYEPGLQGEILQEPASQPQPQLNPQGNVTTPVQQFNPNDMNAFADMGDPDMVDVGILSSFAGNQDVKTLLVEYIPDFVNVLDRIGRIILLFCLQRRELEQYYRVDKINELLQNCRKVFRIVGDLVQSLQVYVNMA